jgi:hypothetical protein
VVPHAGITYGKMKTDFSIPFIGVTSPITFKSRSPYVGIDVSVCFWTCWQVTAMYEYAWPRTETIIADFSQGTAESTGSNVACQVDYYFNDTWSVMASFAVNDSRDKEKNGMTIAGGRVGIGMLF